MGQAHVVDLTLGDARVTDEPDGTEVWTASVTLAGRHRTVSGHGRAENLGRLVAGFRSRISDSEDVGWALCPLLLPEGVEAALQQAYADAWRDDALLSVRIHCTNLVFAALPWELTRTRLVRSVTDPVGSGKQAQLVSNPSRCVVSRVLGHSVPSGQKTGLRSLVVTAADAIVPEGHTGAPDPAAAPRRRVDWTAEAARAARRRLDELGKADLLSSATRERLAQELKTTAHIVCIIAHGWADRQGGRDCGIVLHGSPDDSPDVAPVVAADVAPAVAADVAPDYVPAAELAALLGESGTQLVVLVSCDTAGLSGSRSGWGTAAHHIVAAGVPAVVAMQAPVQQEIGQEFLVGLVAGLTEHGDIHTAMSQGLEQIDERSDIVGHLAVPALYTGRDGLRLRDAPPAPVDGPRHAYPVVPTRRTTKSGKEIVEDTVATDARRVRLDVVWGLERRPFAGVLLDVPAHDLARDLNGWETAWDAPLKQARLPARRWFAADMEQPPVRRSGWERLVTPTQGEWNDFRAIFDRFDPGAGTAAGTAARTGAEGKQKREADDGWILRTRLSTWSPTGWQDWITRWTARLVDSTGRLARPFVVVLQGPVPVIEDDGLSVLAQVREDLERRLGTPITALSRHRPGRRYRHRDPEAFTGDGEPPVTEQALLTLRRQDPVRYGYELARLAADDRLPGRPASLTVAADYDDDIGAWIGALRADQPVPRPSGLPLGVDAERADAIALALLRQRSKLSDADLLAWDDPLLSPPVRRLVRQYRTAWAREQPDEDSLADWLSAHPDSAPALARAGHQLRIGAVLRGLPPTTAPWPLLRAFGADDWGVLELLRLPQLERDALGLIRAESRPAGYDAALRAEHIRKAVGRATTTVRHSSATDKATP